MIDAFFRAIERSGFGHRRSRRWLLKWGATLGSLTAISNRFGLPSRAPAAILNDHDRADTKMNTKIHIAVIGAGAFGGWTALYLLRKGARVTLIDAWGPGNSRASSGGETRVIRATYGPDRPYVQMVVRALALWRENEVRWKRPLFRKTGVLWMAGPDDRYEKASLPLMRAAGLTIDAWSAAEAGTRFPQVNFEGVSWVIHERDAGYLLARRSCQEVLQGFLSEGGDYRQREARPGAIQDGLLREILLSDGSRLVADR